MISRIIRKTVDLSKVQKVDQLEGPLYQLENGGHIFEITCMMDGSPASVSGAVSARFLRADGITEFFTGTLSGNVASITLPQACYNVNGRFGMVVFIAGSGVTSAVYGVAGSVYKTTSDEVVDPTEVIPSLEDLIAKIQDCEDATVAAEAAAAFVPNVIAPAYSASGTYAVGDYCTKDGYFYRCNTAISTAEAWNAAHWTQVTTGGEVGDLKSALNGIEGSLGVTGPSNNLLNPLEFVEGYYSSGVWTESSNYLTSDYMDVSEANSIYVHRFNLNNDTQQDTARYFSYIYWFDSGKNFLHRTDTVSGTTSYAVYSGAKYARVMGVTSTLNSNWADNKGFYVGIEDTSTWIAYDAGGIPNYVEIIDGIESAIDNASVSLHNGIYTIKTNHAQYIIQRVTNQSENLDTYRLYKGDLRKDNALFNMWVNSDAEGAIRIQGETDYVSGFHGSEVMTAFKVFLDGADITSQTSIDSDFNTLMFYVESDVYHCYQDTAVAGTIAFKRCKIVSFCGNKVTVSNSYIPQTNLTISSARIALFQCYKNDGSTPVFTDFSVNTDFKDYAVSTVGTTKPADSEKMTEAILNTTYGRIRFKSILTSGQAYKGSVADFASQNRIKFYFNTIFGTTQVQSGEQIMSQFEFEVT